MPVLLSRLLDVHVAYSSLYDGRQRWHSLCKYVSLFIVWIRLKVRRTHTVHVFWPVRKTRRIAGSAQIAGKTNLKQSIMAVG